MKMMKLTLILILSTLLSTFAGDGESAESSSGRHPPPWMADRGDGMESRDRESPERPYASRKGDRDGDRTMRSDRMKGIDGEFKERYQGLYRFMNKLKADDPELYEKLGDLRKNDPEAFRVEMREQLKKYIDKSDDMHKPFGRHGDSGPRPKSEERRQFMEKVEQYRQSEDPETRERIRDELRGKMIQHAESFEKESTQKLHRLELEIEKVRDQLERTRDQRDQAIERKLDQLLSGSSARRRPGPPSERRKSPSTNP